MIVRTADRQVAVGQAGCANERGLLELPACAVEPNAFVAAKGTQAKFATHRQISRINLVARKYDACKLDPETRRGGPCSLEVCAKRLDVPPLFQAVEMREGVRADLLGRVVENPLDERQAVVIGVALLVWPDLVEIMVGGNSRIGVARLARGKCGEHRRVGRRSEERRVGTAG